MRKLLELTVLASSISQLTACAHHYKLTEFSYVERPNGYHWRASKDANSGATVYYGTDPQNGATVYVGPDSTYYEFSHPPPIEPGDLHSIWEPHDV